MYINILREKSDIKTIKIKKKPMKEIKCTYQK